MLLVSSWDDTATRMETMVLPMFRAVHENPDSDVTIVDIP